MGAAGLLLNTLVSMPPVPFTGCVYKSTQIQETDETTTTFSGFDLGEPHPKRLAIVACHSSGGSPGTMWIGGVPAFWVRAGSGIGSGFAIFVAQIPHVVSSPQIVWSATSSVRKAVSLYIAYPDNPYPIDHGLASATGTTDAVVSDLKAVAKGFAVVSGGQNTVQGGPYTVTWTGADAVITDTQTTYGATELSGFVHCHINFTASSDLDDLTLAETITGTKINLVGSWGPPPGY